MDHNQSSAGEKLPIAVLLAAKNEAINLPRCLADLAPAERIIVLDSYSAENTSDIAFSHGACQRQLEITLNRTV